MKTFVLLMLLIASSTTAMGAPVCAPRGNLCTPPGTQGNNPSCCQAGSVCGRVGSGYRCVAAPTTTTLQGTTTTTSVEPETTTTTTLPLSGARRPDAYALSIARQRGEQYQEIDDHQTNEQERDLLELFQAKAVADAIAKYEDLIPYAARRARYGMSFLWAGVEMKTPYRARTQEGSGGVWQLTQAGAAYSRPFDMLMVIREGLREPAVRFLAAMRMTEEEHVLFDLSPGLITSAGLVFPDVPYDPHVSGSFPVDTRRHFAPCFTGDCTLLDAVEEAHACTVDHDPSECGDVLAAHEAYEAECGSDQDCQWSRRIAPFPVSVARWTPEQVHQWRMLTEIFHALWVQAQRDGNAMQSDFESGRHMIAHVCLAIGLDDLPLVIIPEDGRRPADFYNSYGGEQSCMSILPKLVAAYGLV